MPPRDPSKTQLDNPELLAALISELQIIGQIGLIDFVPAVNPVFIVGSRGLSINVEPPVYQSAEIFSGATQAPAVNAIIADTGALPAGDYDIFCNIAGSGISAAVFSAITLQHRNAANAATLATLLATSHNASGNVPVFGSLPLTGYQLALDERLRVIMLLGNLTGGVTASIGVRRRPTP